MPLDSINLIDNVDGPLSIAGTAATPSPTYGMDLDSLNSIDDVAAVLPSTSQRVTPPTPSFSSPVSRLPISPGVDDLSSLRVSGLVSVDGGWFPKLGGGVYQDGAGVHTLAGIRSSLPITFSTGIQNISLSFLPETRRISLKRGADEFTPVSCALLWGEPAFAQVATAGSFLSAAERGDLPASAILWYAYSPGRAYAVHCSRSARSYDVLADGDALLRRVRYAQDLTNDRLYCEDRARGLVYGLVASELLAPPPFGPGTAPQVYVSLETVPGLQMSEICYVDVDGLVQVRHKAADQVTAFYAAPEGSVALTVGQIQGNAVELLLAGQRLDYGTTVCIRYYVPDSYSITGSGISLYSASSGSGTLSTFLDEWTASSPDLNPLHSGVGPGFLYAGTGIRPLARYGVLELSNPCPSWNGVAGESVTIRAAGLDAVGVPISDLPLTLSSTGSGFLLSSTVATSEADGYAYFTLTQTAAGAAGTLTLKALNGVSAPVAIASTSFIQSAALGRGASVFTCVTEDYQYPQSQTPRKLVRCLAVGPDGFPWPSGDLTLSCHTGAFYDPGARADGTLGTRVTLTLGQASVLLDASGLLTVGYAPVPGDVLSAQLYDRTRVFRAPDVTI